MRVTPDSLSATPASEPSYRCEISETEEPKALKTEPSENSWTRWRPTFSATPQAKRLPLPPDAKRTEFARSLCRDFFAAKIMAATDSKARLMTMRQASSNENVRGCAP